MPLFMKIIMVNGAGSSMNLDKERQAKKFLKWVNDNYEYLKSHHQAYCLNTKQKWDEDIFCDTYLKIYDKILKGGLKDESPRGMECYMFMAFKQNTKRESQYARNSKKDSNVQNLSELQEMYLNSKLTEREKLLQDLKKDFSCLYILTKVDEEFDAETNRLFKMKVFDNNMTYKKLYEKTGVKGIRQKIVDVKNWIKTNITKEEIDNAFNAKYSDLFEY